MSNFRSYEKVKVPTDVLRKFKADRKNYFSQNQHLAAIHIHGNTYRNILAGACRSDVLEKLKKHLGIEDKK